MAGQSKLTEEQVAANKLLKDAKTPEEKATAEKAVAVANENAEKALKEAEEKAKAEKLEKSKNTPVLKKTKDNYVPEPGTEQNYHAKIEVKAFDGQSGKRLSKPSVQIFAPKAFKTFKEQAVGLGYTVDILHDPTGDYPKVGLQPKEETKEK